MSFINLLVDMISAEALVNWDYFKSAVEISNDQKIRVCSECIKIKYNLTELCVISHFGDLL